MPSVVIVARSFRARLYWMEQADIEAEGFMILCQVAKRWDPKRGAKLWTLAEPRVRGHFLSLQRKRAYRADVIRGKAGSVDSAQVERILG